MGWMDSFFGDWRELIVFYIMTVVHTQKEKEIPELFLPHSHGEPFLRFESNLSCDCHTQVIPTDPVHRNIDIMSLIGNNSKFVSKLHEPKKTNLHSWHC
jgi:hypothetical protein